MTDQIGRADYVLGADYTAVVAGTKTAEEHILKTGKTTEDVFAGRTTAAVNAAGAATTRLGGQFDALKGKAAGFASIGDSIKRSWSGGEVGKGLVQGFGLAGGLGAAQLVGNAVRDLAAGIGDSIKAAGDLNETLSKSQVVFGAAAGEVKKFGEGAALAMGLSENAAIGAAATFGNLFKSLGTAPDKIAPMSTAIVSLAADLASFNNISIDEALLKLESGVTGQAEPLRALGIAISDASVGAEAAALGFKAVNGVFTEGEKVQARYSLIFKQTGTAQGDFARTSDSMANQERKLNAEFANTSAALGEKLIPLTESLQRAMIGLFETLAEHTPQTSAISTAIANTISDDSLAALNIKKAALRKGIDDLHGMLFGLGFGSGEAAKLEADLAKVDDAIGSFAERSLDASSKIKINFAAGLRSMGPTAAEAAHAGADAAQAGINGSLARAKAMMGQSMGDAALKTAAHRAGLLAAGALGQGITDARQAPVDAFAKLVEDLKHPLSKSAEVARLLGQLTSSEMAKGLKSGDPAIRDQAIYTKGLILDQLDRISATAGPLSKAAAAAVAKGLKSHDPDIKAAALAIHNHVATPLAGLATDAYGWGEKATIAYANGLRSKIAVAAVQHGAYVSAAAAAVIFKAGSPPGPESPLHKIDVWGENTAHAFAAGIMKGGSSVSAAVKSVLDVPANAIAGASLKFAPTFGTAAAMVPTGVVGGAMAAGSGVAPTVVSGATTHVHLTINNPEPRAAEDDVGWTMRRLSALGMF